MRRLIVPLLMSFALSALAAQEQVTQPQVIELEDGSKLTIRKDGTMDHVDAHGHRVRMKDGVPMEAKDGTTYTMRNNVLWKTLIEKGTLNPKQR